MKLPPKPQFVSTSGGVVWSVGVPSSLLHKKAARRFCGPGAEERARAYSARLHVNRDTVDGLYLAKPAPDRLKILTALELVGGDADRLYAAAMSASKKAAKRAGITLEKAAHDWIVDLQKRNTRPQTWKNAAELTRPLMTYLGKDRLVDSVTRGEIESYLSRRIISPASMGTLLGNMVTFWNFVERQDWCGENPTKGMRKPAVEAKEIRILSVEQCESLLRKAEETDPRVIPYIALRLFAGLRADEAAHIDWFDIQKDHVRVQSEISKTRDRRLVTMTPCLRAWLDVPGDLPAHEAHKRTVAIAELAGVKLSVNVLRHCFVSYTLPLLGIAMTALDAGHAEAILWKHYRALVSKQDAERFFALRPLESSMPVKGLWGRAAVQA